MENMKICDHNISLLREGGGIVYRKQRLRFTWDVGGWYESRGTHLTSVYMRRMSSQNIGT